MLKFKKQKKNTIRFQITEIKTKTTHTSSLLYIFRHDFILIQKLN